jgi:RHS repeat-associated protein
MRSASIRAIWLATLVVAVVLGVQAEPGREAGKYLIVLSDDGPAGAFTVAQLARAYGGTLHPGDDGNGAYCVELDPGAAVALRQDHRVASVRPASVRLAPSQAEAAPRSDVKVAATPPPRWNGVAGESSSWQSGEYSYDGSGSIYRIGSDQLGYDRYTYDELGRIVRGTAGRGAGEQTYSYDGFGNLQTITTTGRPTRLMNVNPATNRLNGSVTGANTLAVYDEAGNQTGENGTSGRSFDAFHNMATNVDGTRYLYDANDERIAVVNAAGTQWRWTVRDLSGRVLREYDETITGRGTSSWTWRKDYVYRGGALLGAYVNENGAEKRVHYHLDHLGTPRLITEAAAGGAVRRQEPTHYPFGEEWAFQIGSTETRHFTGHERDYNGGTAVENANYLDYMHARYYSPAFGRFLSVDPGKDWDMGQPQSWNMYSYVRNNPVNHTDPTGRYIESFIEIASIGIGGRSLYKNVQAGNTGAAAIDGIGIVVDVAALAIPIVPGGAGAAIKAARSVNGIDNAVDTAKNVDRAGMDFTRAGKRQIDEANAAKHGGKNVCDSCGTDVVPAQQHTRGVTPPKNERHRDHIEPKSQGGSGTPGNGRITCRECNLRDGNKPKTAAPCTPGKGECR